MAITAFILAYVEYLVIREIVNEKTDLDLDIFPEYYYDDLRKTWIGAGILLAGFVVNYLIFWLLGWLG